MPSNSHNPRAAPGILDIHTYDIRFTWPVRHFIGIYILPPSHLPQSDRRIESHFDTLFSNFLYQRSQVVIYIWHRRVGIMLALPGNPS